MATLKFTDGFGYNHEIEAEVKERNAKDFAWDYLYTQCEQDSPEISNFEYND